MKGTGSMTVHSLRPTPVGVAGPQKPPRGIDPDKAEAKCVGCAIPIRAKHVACRPCYYLMPSDVRSGTVEEYRAYFAKSHRVYECGCCEKRVVGSARTLPKDWTRSRWGKNYCGICRRRRSESPDKVAAAFDRDTKALINEATQARRRQGRRRDQR